jgi:hypothetical protein
MMSRAAPIAAMKVTSLKSKCRRIVRAISCSNCYLFISESSIGTGEKPCHMKQATAKMRMPGTDTHRSDGGGSG